MISKAIKNKLPKAPIIRVGMSRQGYFAKFRLANACRWQIGKVTITHRAPWLEHVARTYHPELFGDQL